ncbi:MAG: ABC transporter permease, partial [Bacilli bacterium]|nr:ABC transporter permease [Bacilli bacterium]
DTYNRIDLGALLNMGFDTSGDSIRASDIVGVKKYHIISNDDFYTETDKDVLVDGEVTNRKVYKKVGNTHYEELFNNKSKLELSIVSIIRPKEHTNNSIYDNVLLYHPNLTKYLIDENTGINTNSEIVKKQKANPEWDLITGEDYEETYIGNYPITPQYQRESRIVELGGMERVTAYFYYTENFEQRNTIIKHAESYKVDPNSNIIIKTKDYLESVTSSFSSLVRTFSIILLLFSLVSILVASIMTAILTYISVIERKREIGLLRSLGARQRDVSYMFISEASIVGVVAGFLGIGLCYAFSPLVSRVVVSLIDVYNSKMLKPSPDQFSRVQPWLIPVLFAAAIVIGVISSLVPAIIAGHKKPAEALKE